MTVDGHVGPNFHFFLFFSPGKPTPPVAFMHGRGPRGAGILLSSAHYFLFYEAQPVVFQLENFFG